jgi:uncharacterized membrane protein
MELSPEEKRRIYEEEKARIEAQEKKKRGKRTVKEASTTNLKPNVAGLLCYLGFWVTGIIFLFIDRRNRLVRFHAMQSMVAFGIVNIIWGTARAVGGWPWIGIWNRWIFYGPEHIAAIVIFIIFYVIWWVLWAVLMYKTYKGQPYRVPVFSDLAEKCLAKLDG